MKMAKAIRQQAATAERVAVNTADTYVADQMRALAQAFRIQAEIIKKTQEKEEKMSFSIKATCQHGDLVHRRKTADAALKKAREMSRAGCYDIHHHDARRAGLPLFRVRGFAAYARRCARAPENPPARQANSDVAYP